MHRSKGILNQLIKVWTLADRTSLKLFVRWQGTNFGVYNPSARIREKRERDPRIWDEMTRKIVRPCLPESIVPPYCLPEKEAPPWPYWEKGYFYYHRLLDNTTKRFDENTRIISVEGNIGSGCSDFARELAKIIGFHYIRQPKIEDILIDSSVSSLTCTPYGIDKRDFYHLLPEKYCLFDTEMFFTAPKHPMVIVRAYYMFLLKVEAYCNALAHLLNTGQGVVLERSVFSDIVFVRAMYEKGFVDETYADFYEKFRMAVLDEFKLLPHLVIYLDAPVSTCMEKIKKRGRVDPWELNGKVIDYNYLACLEDEFKCYLRRAEKDSAILTLDWKTPANMDAVADEVYKVDFSYDFNESDRFEKWNLTSPESEWNELRQTYTQKRKILNLFELLHVKVPELVTFPHEVEHFRYVIEKIVGKYAAGYNRSRGDKLKDILFNKYSDCIVSGNWHEYVLRDALWAAPYNTLIYFDKPYMPNIPDEEFEPRRFDPKCLEDSDSHHLAAH